MHLEKSAYTINIPALDAQHARWIALVEAFRVKSAPPLESREIVASALTLLKDLIDYTAVHFTSEEKYFEACHLPTLENHKRQHRALVEHLAQLRNELVEYGVNEHTATFSPIKLRFLADVWLMEHIHKDDRDAARYLADHGLIPH